MSLSVHFAPPFKNNYQTAIYEGRYISTKVNGGTFVFRLSFVLLLMFRRKRLGSMLDKDEATVVAACGDLVEQIVTHPGKGGRQIDAVDVTKHGRRVLGLCASFAPRDLAAAMYQFEHFDTLPRAKPKAKKASSTTLAPDDEVDLCGDDDDDDMARMSKRGRDDDEEEYVAPDEHAADDDDVPAKKAKSAVAAGSIVAKAVRDSMVAVIKGVDEQVRRAVLDSLTTVSARLEGHVKQATQLHARSVQMVGRDAIALWSASEAHAAEKRKLVADAMAEAEKLKVDANVALAKAKAEHDELCANIKAVATSEAVKIRADAMVEVDALKASALAKLHADIAKLRADTASSLAKDMEERRAEQMRVLQTEVAESKRACDVHIAHRKHDAERNILESRRLFDADLEVRKRNFELTAQREADNRVRARASDVSHMRVLVQQSLMDQTLAAAAAPKPAPAYSK